MSTTISDPNTGNSITTTTTTTASSKTRDDFMLDVNDEKYYTKLLEYTREVYLQQNTEQMNKLLYDTIIANPEKNHVDMVKDLVQCLLDGKDGFYDSLKAYWQNLCIVAALIGAIAVSIMVSPIDQASMFSAPGADDRLNPISAHQMQKLARAYYVIWSLAAITEISTVIILTVLNVHFTLMESDFNRIWFLIKWKYVYHVIPEGLAVLGSMCLFAGCALGAFIICDMATGIVVSLISGFAFMSLLLLWMYMFYVNESRERDGLQNFRGTLQKIEAKIKQTKP